MPCEMLCNNGNLLLDNMVLYVVLMSDNSFEIYVDQDLVNSGNLLEDMRFVC